MLSAGNSLFCHCCLSAALPVFAQVPAGDVRIHYYRPDGNYSGWGLYAWNATTASYSWCSSQVAQTGTDSFGVYFDVPVTPTAGSPAGQLGFIINNCANGQIKDPGPNQYLQVTEYTQGWVVSGNPTVFYNQPILGTNPVPAGDVRIHYYRPDSTYTGWGVYAWNATTASYSWCSSQVSITGIDSFGVYYDIPVTPTNGSPAGQLGFIINNCDDGGTKDPGSNQYLQVTEYTQGWVISGNVTVFYSQPATGTNPVPAGDARIHYYSPRWQLHRLGTLRLERHHSNLHLVLQPGGDHWRRRIRRLLRCSGYPHRRQSCGTARLHHQQLRRRPDQRSWSQSIPADHAVHPGLGPLRQHYRLHHPASRAPSSGHRPHSLLPP